SLDRLAAFIADPLRRYPDGRMPKLPAPDGARHLAAYLLLWSKPRAGGAPQDAPPSREEIEAASRRAGAENPEAAGEALIRAKRCGRCHPGLPEPAAAEVSLAAPYPGKGCLSGKTLPRFALDPETRR